MWLELIWRNFWLYIFVIFTFPPISIFLILISPFDRRRKVAHWISRRWMPLALWIAGVKVHVSGQEVLDPQGVYIFAANHQSQFDIPVVETALPREIQIRWLAKKSLFKIPFFGWAMWAAGYIPVDRKNPREGLKSLIEAVEKVRQGASVVIFPEGTRSPDGRLLPFKGGGFVLAVKSGCPVVPVAICGTHKIMPKGRLVARPGTVYVKILSPIPAQGLSLRDKEKLAQKTRESIAKALEAGCR